MIIDDILLNSVSEQAQASPRLRMDYNFMRRVNIPARQWHGLEVLEEGSVICECKDGPYTPVTEEDLMAL